MNSRVFEDDAMFHQPLSQNPPHSKRCKLKCPNCRKSRKGCKRPFLTAKCDRCKQFGYECGPSRLPDCCFSTANQTAGIVHPNTHFSQNSLSEQSESTDQSIDSHSHVDFTTSPASDIMTGVEIEYGQQSSTSATLLSLALGAMLQMARLDCRSQFDKITIWPERASYSKCICEDLSSYAKRLKSKIKTLEEAEVQLRRIQISQLTRESSWQTASNNISHFNTTDTAYNIDKVILACTRNIIEREQTPTCSFAHWGAYITVEQHLSKILRQILRGHNERGFSAAQIAYLNKDTEAMLELCARLPQDQQKKDVLGRDLAHLLVETGDKRTLLRLLEKDPTAVARAKVDERGLSLLALAAIDGHLNRFDILMQWGAKPDRDDEKFLLDLAIIGGKLNLIQYMVPENQSQLLIVFPPYEKATRKCIELGRPHLARPFLKWLNQACWNSPDAINDLSQLAAGKGTNEADALARELQNILVKTNTAQQAIQDVRNTHSWLAEQHTGQQQASGSPSTNILRPGPTRSYAQVVRGGPNNSDHHLRHGHYQRFAQQSTSIHGSLNSLRPPSHTFVPPQQTSSQRQLFVNENSAGQSGFKRRRFGRHSTEGRPEI